MASVTSAVRRAPRNRRSRHFRAGIACEPLDRRVLMAAGDLDTTFNNVGFASLAFPGASFQIVLERTYRHG